MLPLAQLENTSMSPMSVLELPVANPSVSLRARTRQRRHRPPLPARQSSDQQRVFAPRAGRVG